VGPAGLEPTTFPV